jgi:hypothetical protein
MSASVDHHYHMVLLIEWMCHCIAEYDARKVDHLLSPCKETRVIALYSRRHKSLACF